MMTKHPELKLKSIKTLLIIFFTELVLYVTRVAPLSYAWRARSFTYFYAHCLLQILLYLMLKQSHTNVLPHIAWLICNHLWGRTMLHYQAFLRVLLCVWVYDNALSP